MFSAVRQGKFATKTGQISFEAFVPFFEEVKAENTNVSAVLEISTGNFAALALMKGFRFKVALMEEHFNENYIESSKYPKATFKGTIQDFDWSTLSDKSDYIIKGTFNIHGVDNNFDVPAKIVVNGETVLVTAQFVLLPEDFNIKIPSIVSSKIAKDVNVNVALRLESQ